MDAGIVGRARTRIALGMLAVIALVGAIVVTTATRAEAANGADFDPGYIISDANFYDGRAMSADDVQRFLDQQVPTCRATTGPTCLRYYTMDTPSRAANGTLCAAYTGGTAQRASKIIADVGAACGISQRVLLVLLQKEQSLVTSTAPSTYSYRAATGYGCPDTAACDTTYYGFFNQVYSAALQYKRYLANPSGWNYRVGVNSILYHPNSACGRKDVTIRNEATRALYIYTPYTPNAAALTNLYGTGDGCSSYGNRNFWRLYSDWFGSPVASDSPYGQLVSVAAGFKNVRLVGWAVDPDTSDPINAHVYLDGVHVTTALADRVDSRFTASYNAFGENHAFDITLDGIAAGAHEVCVYAINTGPGRNVGLGCSRFTIAQGSPLAILDAVSATPGVIAYRGWALDPDQLEAIDVRVSLNGSVVATQSASETKTGLGNAFPGYGDEHGFSGTIEITGGTHQVCITAVNVGAGSDTSLGCRWVSMPTGSPFGVIDAATAPDIGRIQIRGWTIDPDLVGPIRVHTYIDNQLAVKGEANLSKVGLNGVFPGYGDEHGYLFEAVGYTPGTHHVCVYAINVGAGGNTLIGCRTVQMPVGSPIGVIDQASSSGPGQISVRGWALDPDVASSIRVHSYVDGVLSEKVTADVVKVGLSEFFPGYSDSHGYQIEIAGLAPGDREVCLFAINAGVGGNAFLGCRMVAVG